MLPCDHLDIGGKRAQYSGADWAIASDANLKELFEVSACV